MIKLKLNEDILNSLEGAAKWILNKIVIPAEDIYKKASMNLATDNEATIKADSVAIGKSKASLINILELDPTAVPLDGYTISTVNPIDYDQRIELKNRAENALKNLAELDDAIEDRLAEFKGKAAAEKRRETMYNRTVATLNQTKEKILNLGVDLIIDNIDIDAPYYDNYDSFTSEEEKVLTKLMKDRWIPEEAKYADLAAEVAQCGFNVNFKHNAAYEKNIGNYYLRHVHIKVAISKENLTEEQVNKLKEIIENANVREGKDSLTDQTRLNRIISHTNIFGTAIMEMICDHEKCIKSITSYSDKALDQEFPTLPKEEYPSDYDSELFDQVEAQIGTEQNND